MVVRCWKVLNVRDGESISITWCPTLDTVFCAMNAVLRNVGQRPCGWLIMRPHYLGGSRVRRGPQECARPHSLSEHQAVG